MALRSPPVARARRRGHQVDVIHDVDAYRMFAHARRPAPPTSRGRPVHGLAKPARRALLPRDAADRAAGGPRTADPRRPARRLRRHPLPQHLAGRRPGGRSATGRASSSTPPTSTGWCARRTCCGGTTANCAPAGSACAVCSITGGRRSSGGAPRPPRAPKQRRGRVSRA